MGSGGRDPDNYGRRVTDADDQLITEREEALQRVSTAEVLWGGRRGEGLVFMVTRLSESVDKISETVVMLATQVTGEGGVRAQITRLENRLENERIARDKTHDENGKRIGWFIALAGPGLLWLVGRSIQIAMVGHL